MIDLTNTAYIRSLCARHGIRAKKALGQNFLQDASVLDRIVDAAMPEGSGILEIGPGLGTLTRALAPRARKVLAVELDRDLLPVLTETLADCPNTSVLYGDILKMDIPSLLAAEFQDMPVSVAANLPYYITTPIILALLEQNLPIHRMVFMVQKEVCDRMLAAPGTKAYGAFTVAVQYRCRALPVCTVPASAFSPAPQVDSAVIALEFYKEKPYVPKEEKHFFSLVRAVFAQRRKTLANGLANAGRFGNKETIADAIAALRLSPSVRGETLSIEQLVDLSDRLLQINQ